MKARKVEVIFCVMIESNECQAWDFNAVFPQNLCSGSVDHKPGTMETI